MSARPRPLDCRATALTLSVLVVVVVAAIGVVDPPLAIALMAENSAAESLQVILMAAAGALAARHAWPAVRAGRSAVLDSAIVTAMGIACVSEVDLDRKVFGVKIVATLFFLDPKYPLAAARAGGSGRRRRAHRRRRVAADAPEDRARGHSPGAA